MSDVHDNISSLIAAYAIGAVPEDEIPAIRAHIMSCDDCFSEAESYATSLAVLAELVEPVPLSKGFEDRVLGEIHASAATPPSRARRRTGARPRTWLVAGAATAVAALLVVAVISLVQVVTLQQQYREVVAALVHDSDAFTLQGPGGAEGAIASTPDGSVLVALDLGAAPSGKDYQLWLMRDGEPTPADTFDADAGVVIVESTRSLEGFEGAAVTVEPEGGSEQPTTDPVLSSG
jgi:anti-sigma-K factor RskA